MRKNASILTTIVCTVLLGGCASIMHGTAQEVTFQSSPEEVTVTVTGRIIGKTPITTRLDKKSGQSMTFTKDGYKPLTMELTTLARACGKSDVHHLEREDLVALTIEAAAMAKVPLAGTNWIPGVTT